MLRIGMAQLNTTVGDLEGNADRLIAAIDRARDLGVDIVSFPELSITGYPPEDLLLKPDFIEGNLAALGRVAAATQGIAAVVGFVDREGPRLYNAAAVLADGTRVGVYHKQRLPNYGVFDEKRYFQPGRRAPVFVIRGVPVGITICEDIWLPGGACQAEAAAGALVVININGSPYHRGKWQEREAILRARARDCAVVIAYNNLVGGQDELVFDGTGMVVDPSGRLVARGAMFEEDLVVFDVHPEAVRRRRGTILPPPGDDGQAIDVPTIHVSAAAPRRRPAVSPRIAPVLEPVEEVYRALVLGTRDYLRKNGFSDAVVGLSGGIDSSLVAVIAADALGPAHVHTVWMPSRFSSEESRRYAAEVSRALGAALLEVPIDPIFQAYLDALREPFAGRGPDTAEENIQARIRGTLLMALSNKFGWLVLTTGNKSEMSVGYATLYGDMAGGFAVLKDVPKTLVYELARWRNHRSPVIPEGVLTRAPTAELRAGQTDEAALGVPYRVLDPILKLYVEEDRSPDEIVAAGYPADVVARVVAMVDRNEYKRRQAPPGIKITPKAFGKDRRLPITNRYRHPLASQSEATGTR
ncbi:MAG TPA: NAD+ synthase [bacterium]|nr:NAD+ synthase [bacterium]